MFGKRDVIVHGTDPFNAETEPAALAEGAITATDAFYVRNHGAVPERRASGGCGWTARWSGRWTSRSPRCARRCRSTR